MAQDKARGGARAGQRPAERPGRPRSTQAGERVAGTASDVRSIAAELRNQGKDAPGELGRAGRQPGRPGGRLSQGGQRGAAPARRRGRRPPPAHAGRGRWPRAQVRRLTVHEGVEQPPLPVRLPGLGQRRLRPDLRHRFYDTGTSTTSTFETGSAGTYATEVPYAPATTPATGTPGSVPATRTRCRASRWATLSTIGGRDVLPGSR